MFSKKPFVNFVINTMIIIALLLWVILPDFIPFLIDDLIAFVGAVTLAITTSKDFIKSLKM